MQLLPLLPKSRVRKLRDLQWPGQIAATQHLIPGANFSTTRETNYLASGFFLIPIIADN